jgi:hypothetical protein|tara:strand:+ start:200 stop:478 length:279 start_codon:yes stop_codon:yes gene_type:complete
MANFTTEDGNTYEGDINADENPHGQGTYIWTDGRKYVGEWKDGKFNGQGTFTYTDGSTYVGEHTDWERTGQGTFTSSDGEKYVGEWKDGTIL